MITFIDKNENEHGAITTLKVTNAVNGERSISGTIYSNDDVLNNIDRGWRLRFDTEYYVITYAKPKDSDDNVQVSFDAVHQFFWDFAKSAVHTQLNDGSHTFQQYLEFIFQDSGYRYRNEVTVNAFEKQSFGLKNRLPLFNDIIASAGVEFTVTGKVVRIVEKVGTDLSTVVRKNFNLNELTIEKNINGFYTYQKGFGAWFDDDNHAAGRLETEYASPLVAEYGRLEGPPLVDERYTIESNLRSALKKNVDSSYSISVQLDMEELSRAGYRYTRPVAGDYIMAINEAVGFKEKIRIVSFTSEYDATGVLIDRKITCNDIGSIQKQNAGYNNLNKQLNNTQQDLVNAVKTANKALVSADGKNTNYFGTSFPVDRPKGTLTAGDRLYLTVGEEVKTYVWTGAEWQLEPIVNDVEQFKEEVNQQLQETNEAIKNNQTANDTKIAEALEKAGVASDFVDEARGLIAAAQKSEQSPNLIRSSGEERLNWATTSYVLDQNVWHDAEAYTFATRYWHGGGATALRLHVQAAGRFGAGVYPLAYDKNKDYWYVTFKMPDDFKAGAEAFKLEAYGGIGNLSWATLVKGSLPMGAWQPAASETIAGAEFNTIKETVNTYIRTIGSTESEIGGKISQLVMTDSAFVSRVGEITFGEKGNLVADPVELKDYQPLGTTDPSRLSKVNWGTYKGIRLTVTGNSTGRNGFKIPLVKRTLKAGTYSFRVRLVVDKTFSMGSSNGTAAFFLNVGDNGRNEAGGITFWQEPLTKTGSQVVTRTFTLSEDITDSYLLRFEAMGNGQVAIQEFTLIEGSTPPATFITHEDTTSAVSEMSQTAGAWSIRNLNSSGDVLNQINLNKDGSVLIDGSLVRITGKTVIDDATIASSKLINVSADKITTGTLNAGSVNVINLNASNITTGTMTAERISGGILSANNGRTTFNLNTGRLDIGNDGQGWGTSYDAAGLSFYDGSTRMVSWGGYVTRNTATPVGTLMNTAKGYKFAMTYGNYSPGFTFSGDDGSVNIDKIRAKYLYSSANSDVEWNGLRIVRTQVSGTWSTAFLSTVNGGAGIYFGDNGRIYFSMGGVAHNFGYIINGIINALDTLNRYKVTQDSYSYSRPNKIPE